MGTYSISSTEQYNGDDTTSGLNIGRLRAGAWPWDGIIDTIGIG
jgi:hypothetical protein